MAYEVNWSLRSLPSGVHMRAVLKNNVVQKNGLVCVGIVLKQNTFAYWMVWNQEY